MNEDQKGVLGELINIAFGTATAIIADLFDSFATLRIPNIELIPISEINEVASREIETPEFYLTSQQIKGSFTGEIVLAVGGDSARNMQQIIGDDGDADDSGQQQNILEIANILGTSCMGKFAELLETEISFSPPSIELTDRIIKDLSDSPYSVVIVISTVLDFDDLDIQGNLMILFGEEMYAKLGDALDRFVENI